MAKHSRHTAGQARISIAELLERATTAVSEGDFRLGTRHLAEALKSQPSNPLVYLALGDLHFKAGQLLEAEADFKWALDLDPELAEAAVGLVKVRLARGQQSEAEELARSFKARFSKDLVLGQILSQILGDQSRTEEAIQELRDILAIHPQAASVMASLARRLSESGELDESRKWFEQAFSVDPSTSLAYLGWVQTKSLGPNDMGIVHAMEAALRIRSLSKVDRMQILFALGKALGDLRDFEKSMSAFHEANEIRETLTQKSEPYQQDLTQSFLDLIQTIFTRENIENRLSLYESDPTPIFIVGMFRSGTTLVEQILSNHSSVAAGGEISYWMDVSAGCFDHSSRTFDFERAMVLRKPYQSGLRKLTRTANYVTDKMPGNYRLLGLLRILFPKAKFIHCTRHPVDICLSIYMTPFSTPPVYASDPKKLIGAFRLYKQTMAHWQTALGSGLIHEVSYEDLIEDPETVTRKLLSFCDLEFEQACLSPESNRRTVKTASAWQVRQAIYRTSAQKWRQYEPWLGEFKTLLTDDDLNPDAPGRRKRP